MKPTYLIFILIATAALRPYSVKAQFESPRQEKTGYDMPKPGTPEWVSDKGYWVIKSSKYTPKESTIYFYNNSHNMVYQEEIKNQKLKLKKKTLLKLKAALEEAVASYEKGTWTNRNEIVLQHLK